MMYAGYPNATVLPTATALWQAKNYDGGHKWLDEIGSADFQFGSATASAYIGRESYGDEVGLVLPGTSGNYASTPDTAVLDITGDITLVAHAALADWTPAATTGLIGKWGVSNQKAYTLSVLATGALYFGWSTDGATTLDATSTVSTGFTNGAAHWVAVTFDVDNGASGRDVKFWTSTDGLSWTQLGATVTTATATSIFNSTAVGEIGSLLSGTAVQLTGSIARTQIWNGIRDLNASTGATLVFDANFSAQTPGVTSFTEGTGKVVTVNRSTTGVDTNDPLFLSHSTSLNPFGAGVDYVALPGTSVNDRASTSLTFGGENHTIFARVYQASWTVATTSPITGGDGATEYRRHLGRVGSKLALRISASGTGSGLQQIAHGITGSGVWWIKSEWVQSTKTWTVWKSSEATNDPLAVASWTSLGSAAFSDTPATYTGSQCIGRGFTYAAHDAMDGYVSRVTIQQGLHSTSTLSTLIGDFNPSGGTINSAQSTLTGTGDGKTWTFSRATTGRKLAVVDEDKFLLGTDDYFTTPDNADLEFGTGTDWSAVFVARRWDAGGLQNHVSLRKRTADSNEYGWQVRISGSTRIPLTIEKDATGTTVDTSGLTYTLGERSVITGVSSRTNATVQTFKDTTAGTQLTSATARDTDGATVLELGRTNNTSANYADCEIVSAAIFKGKALTSDEVASVVSELT